jgi:alpha-1,6-mannosyltransferase
VALGLRTILLVSEPSDDIWRYIWEGRVQLEGFSPYLHPPDDSVLEGLRNQDWLKINHPEVSTIYPPLAQLGIRMLAWMNPATWFFKFAMLIPDLAICGLLVRRFGVRRSLIYAWNPMAIYSFAGAGHFDAWYLLPLVAGWLLIEIDEDRSPWLKNRSELVGALLIGVSVAVKWVTLPILGWLVWQQLRKREFGWAATLLGVGLLPFLLALALFVVTVDELGPILPQEFTMKTRGCELVPWIVQQGWPLTYESNRIFLVAIGLVAGLLMVCVRRIGRMAELLVVSLLVLGPSNHAWYFTWGLPFAVASRNCGSIFLSLTGFTYFRLHLTLALTGRWVLTGFERAILWGLPVLGWVAQLIFGWRGDGKR